ncbi:hypothetical protein [Nocardia sp. NPDC051981]|uniref:hypothetical protein n=1 Tax=Nocardia sp. NPDC051981 TaxID=3155417 RepID=UPI00343DBC3E
MLAPGGSFPLWGTVVPLLQALGDKGITRGSLTVKRPSLGDVFLTLTGRSLREGDRS